MFNFDVDVIMVYKKLVYCDRIFDDICIDMEWMIDNNYLLYNVFIVCLIFFIDVSILLKNYNMVFFIVYFILYVFWLLYSKMWYKNVLE